MKETTASISELADLFRTGKIERDQYWRLMRHQHTLLRNYRQIVKDSQIRSILIEEHGLVVQLDNELKFGWNPEDVRQAVSIAINHGDYETTERQILEVVAEGAEVILDVGANCGWYAIHLQECMARSGIIYAFEPVPKTHEELKANIHLNNLQDKIKEQNFALSDRSGTAVMYLPNFSGSPAASLRNLHEKEENIEVECKLEQLDEFCHAQGLARIDLIKCDVEGAELRVLQGMEYLLKMGRVVTVIVEVHTGVLGQTGCVRIFTLMQALGFQANGIGEEGSALVSSIQQTASVWPPTPLLPGHRAHVYWEQTGRVHT